MTQVVKFPDAVWGRLASIAEAKKAKIADVIVEAAQALLEQRPVEVPAAPGPKGARPAAAPAPEPVVLPKKRSSVDLTDPALIAKVTEMHEMRKHRRLIEIECGLTEEQLRRLLRDNGMVPETHHRRVAVDEDKLRELFGQGLTDKAIAEAMFVSASTIGRVRWAVIQKPANSRKRVRELGEEKAA
ncbi:hypothetical protein [Leifsonia sp. P73]|uniref:hypothetical protein n=1 Tax=Leifsonia sp. P73 TaxID=3423959 RepID=UPI003DA677E3